MAPEASLLAYRISGCVGGTSDEGASLFAAPPSNLADSELFKVILEALSRAVADDADIITMSYTGWNWSSSDPIAIAANQIVENGKVFVAGAGDLV